MEEPRYRVQYPKIDWVKMILTHCTERGESLTPVQIDVILEALTLTEHEKDVLAGELLAWRTEQARKLDEQEFKM